VPVSAAPLAAGVVISGLALVLGLAGVAKLRNPQTAVSALRAAGLPFPGPVVRVLALLELAVSVVGLTAPGRVGGALLAGAFAVLATGAAVAARSGAPVSCGCFGEADGAPVGTRHVLVDLGAAAAGAVAAVVAPAALIAGSSSLSSVLPLAGGALLALGLRAAMRGTGGGSLRRPALALVESSARALETRFSRRSALVRVAVAGSALSIAPLRYLLYPGTALGVVVPGSCAGGLCDDGYTAFCCEINEGVNGCPADTFIGGWWMCTDYRGHQLCADSGVRYYIDCNAIPRRPFPGGCRCAEDNCDHRRVNCNVFRYGQCNTQVRGTTPVVCRVVTCENPGHLHADHCSTALMVDDAVCAHEAGCLEPPPEQLVGAGGA
jgi:hypothetical protein